MRDPCTAITTRVITRTEDPTYIQTRPDWILGSPYRTHPLPPLPILPPMKRKSKTVKIETSPVVPIDTKVE
jgi:hypothetical protein